MMKNSSLGKFLLVSIILVASVLTCLNDATAANMTDWENYSSGNIKRAWYDDGSIYEYRNENPSGFPKWFGRTIFAYSPTGYNGTPGYRTWNWGSYTPTDPNGQVIIEAYAGTYSVTKGSLTWEQNPSWKPAHLSQRRTAITYDYHGNSLNLNTATNGWIEREKTIYADDGITVSEIYRRDSLGRLIESIVVATNLRSTYSGYFTTPSGAVNMWRYKYEYAYSTSVLNTIYEYEAYPDPSGTVHHRLIKEIHAVASGYHLANTYYKYVYRVGTGFYDTIHYKNVFTYPAGQESGVLNGTVAGTLDASYEYISSDYMVKRNTEDPAAATKITVLKLGTGGNWYNWTYLDLDPSSQSYGVLHIYNYDASWNLTSIEKHYPNGVVEICDPTWKVTSRQTPTGTFMKGVNLPWNNYGYDIGSTIAGYHNGFSRNLDVLYQKMDPYKGMMVRMFLFTDLRSGVTFDANGIPTGFTANVYEDMDALLACAKSLGIKVMPVLFDYLLGAKKDANGVWQRGVYAGLIDDPVKRPALINIMRGFIDRYKGNTSIEAWDIMNEPEWIFQRSSMANSTVYEFLREFAGMITGLGEKVTVGNHDSTDLINMVNYWVAQGYTSPLLTMYQFHYYSSFSEADNPFTHTAASFNLGAIPILVGEIGTADVTNRLTWLGQNGYLGGLFWQDGQPDTGENKISAAQLQEILKNGRRESRRFR
ncbi:MAG: hypothetical protein NTZ95_04865 [Candidatus Omnitrophica bacterium]|nr:hypothetical protein [Candidatus Omnitrophota bacterium]